MGFNLLSLYTPICVTWTDVQVTDGPHDPDDFMANFRACERRTLGFYLGSKDRHLFMCETDDRDNQCDYKVERINQIPLAYIRVCIRFSTHAKLPPLAKTLRPKAN